MSLVLAASHLRPVLTQEGSANMLASTLLPALFVGFQSVHAGNGGLPVSKVYGVNVSIHDPQ